MKRAGAYLTVYLSLSLSIVLSLFFVLIEGARRNMIRMQVELATDAAMNSVLGEFNRELLRQYDLFFVDEGYGTSSPSDGRVREHLLSYLKQNYTRCGKLPFGADKSFTGLATEELCLTGTRCAADREAAALREQITAYMLADPAGEAAAELLSLVYQYQAAGADETEWSRRKAENERDMQELKERAAQRRREKEEQGEQLPPAEQDPVEAADSFLDRLALYQVLGHSFKVSEASADPDCCLSRRALHTGSGLEVKNTHGYAPAGPLLFGEYVMEKCSYFRNRSKDGRLSYQIEYILFGESSDESNLNRMAGRLLLIRAGINSLYLFSDSGKQGEAEALATTVCTVLLVPEMSEVMKTAILLAWAYVESLQDVKTIFAGGKVPLIKDSGSWKTTLFSILAPGVSTRGEKGGSGFGYEEYLRVFLFLENGWQKSCRLMDIMEMDIRKTEGNENFRMDWCMDSFALESSTRSAFGYVCPMRREISYN
ncbi:DUF5702 domain-containing protein [Lachnoclostridium sp. Marseille-P6806]|uniref:DUF5702 domain-containing protein n=1 Tax=Lachnoclostridium sp. Marseille-P6806 TaxID=2364793 RepID=UPI0010312B23|nr:DUF5702 domain-containing protein [Lachnoclostridium sp. Marseille-P6806]